MREPWLDVTLEDYEGHMRSEQVNQLAPLADCFAEALKVCVPTSVAIVGVAGGNGLDRIDTSRTQRIVGIDINPHYLAAVRQRHPDFPGLELHRADMIAQPPAIAPAQLVYAALLFEHTCLEHCLTNCISLVVPDGYFAAVLQLPSKSVENVAPTPFSTIQNLKEHFTLISPSELTAAVLRHGFEPKIESEHPLAGGKSLWLAVFRHPK